MHLEADYGCCGARPLGAVSCGLSPWHGGPPIRIPGRPHRAPTASLCERSTTSAAIIVSWNVSRANASVGRLVRGLASDLDLALARIEVEMRGAHREDHSDHRSHEADRSDDHERMDGCHPAESADGRSGQGRAPHQLWSPWSSRLERRRVGRSARLTSSLRARPSRFRWLARIATTTATMPLPTIATTATMTRARMGLMASTLDVSCGRGDSPVRCWDSCPGRYRRRLTSAQNYTPTLSPPVPLRDREPSEAPSRKSTTSCEDRRRRLGDNRPVPADHVVLAADPDRNFGWLAETKGSRTLQTHARAESHRF